MGLLEELSAMSNEIPDLEKPEEEVSLPEADPIMDHWALFERGKEMFKQIFPIDKRERMERMLNYLRLDSTVWNDEAFDSGKRGFVVVPEIFAKFNKVLELAAGVQCYHLRSLPSHRSDVEEEARWKKEYHDMCMIMYRHKRVHLKANREFPLALLTPGTVIEFKVENGSYPEAQVVTVDYLTNCEMHNGLVHTKETFMRPGNWRWSSAFPTSEKHQFNTSHITKIIKNVPGKILIKSWSEQTMEMQYARHDAMHKVGKSKKTYCTYNGVNAIIPAEVERLGILKDVPQKMDFENFWLTMIEKCPGIKRSTPEEYWDFSLISIRKKKFKRWVRQNMNRFLVTMYKQNLMEEEYQRSTDLSMTDMLEFDD